MTKKDKALIAVVVTVLVSLNIALGMFVLEALTKDTANEQTKSEDIITKAEEFLVDHDNRISNRNYNEAYEDYGQDYRDKVSLEKFTELQALEEKLYSENQVLDYIFMPEEDGDHSNIQFKVKTQYRSNITGELIKQDHVVNILYRDGEFYLDIDTKDIEKALAYNYHDMALLSFKEGNDTAAIENALKGLDYAPQQGTLYLVKGKAEFLSNKFSDAIESMNKALPDLEMDNDKAQAYACMAGSYASMGDFSKAKEFMDKAKNLDPSDGFVHEINQLIEGGELPNTGDLKSGKKDGYGTITDPDGTVYEGQLKDDVPNGVGTFTMYTGEKQYGEYKDGLLHGKGVVRFPDYSIYIGTFDRGEFHGEGIHYYDNDFLKVSYNYGYRTKADKLSGGITNFEVPWYYQEEWSTYAEYFWKLVTQSPARNSFNGNFNMPEGIKIRH